ncbi:MAG: metallophosphoesterase family protein [Nitrospinae bacterium]|nr:metallophosphoesterase family protein [Nitrospinota bacterium]
MKTGLISDTHLPALGLEPPPQVAHAFAGVDLILHAGDIYSAGCLDWLERIAPVLAVEVSPAPVIGDPRVAERRVIQIAGHSIGLVHDLQIQGMGWEVVPGIIASRFPPERSLPAALESFFGQPVDIVVCGHTHVPMVETHQGILLVNPGSPTLPNQTRRLGTVGILETTLSTREARIVDLKGLPE